MRTSRSEPFGRNALALAWAVWMSLVAACGGSDSAPPPTTIGTAGGTATGPAGAQVVVPPNALSAATTIAIAQSSSGAPALPANTTPAGQMFALTPHGTSFAVPATVTIPFDPSSIPAGTSPVLLKTNATQTGWDVVPGATVSGAFVQAQVVGFSWTIVTAPPSVPTITAQPQSQSVVEPGAATFNVGATGLTGSGLLAFQWKRDGVPVAGANRASYTTGATSVAADNGATYSVDVSNNVGSVSSSAATLTVTGSATPPVIGQQPADATAALGAVVVFSVTATGTAPAYQWQRSADGGASYSNIGGANTSSYSLTANVGDNGARFRVVISNGVGTVTSNSARLTVTSGSAAAPPQLIAAGSQFSLAIQPGGSILAWGCDGCLGNGSMQHSSAPVTVLGINDAVTVSASSHALVVRRTDGSVWGWGYNGFSQLGNEAGPCGGGCSSALAPVRAGTLTGMVGVAAGGLHSLAVKSDGTVWAWGNNDHGQLGDGTITERTRPIQVPALAGVRAVAAGNQFSLALKSDGTVWAWGSNDAGQLGDGSTTERHAPVQVAGLSAVLAISAGSSHAMALVDDAGNGSAGFGTARVWGANDAGQLGIGNFANARTPVPLSGVLQQVAAGGLHSVLLYFDTVAFTMGRNVEGQLGDGTNTQRNTPTFVAAIDCDSVATGSSHTLCVKHGTAGGEVWAWGWNAGGQLGDGSTTDRKLPVRAAGVGIR